jgi:hypothetical protein
VGTLKNPVLFSAHFGLPTSALRDAGLLDPILNFDTKLYVDPLLLSDSSNATVAGEGVALFDAHFRDVVRLLQVSSAEGDVAWRNAERRLPLNERRETCLGYGNTTVGGSGRNSVLRRRVLVTAKEIVDLGISDPELFGLLSFLEEGIGADTVSDRAANAIMPALAKVTQEFCREHGIPLASTGVADAPLLPINPYDTRRSGVVLVPLDILRDLPLANSRDDVSRVCAQNEEIRARVSAMLGEIAKATVRERKKALREYALADADAFNTLLKTVLRLGDEAYDAEFDPQGHLVLRQALTAIANKFPLVLATAEKSLDALQGIVRAILNHFKQLVEHNNLHELLWFGNKPRKERAAQKLFYGIADAYCKANNIDISPETDQGGGHSFRRPKSTRQKRRKRRSAEEAATP